VNFVAGLLRNGVGRRWGSQWLHYANVERKTGEKWGSGTLWPHGGEGKGGGGCGQWRATRGVTEGGSETRCSSGAGRSVSAVGGAQTRETEGVREVAARWAEPGIGAQRLWARPKEKNSKFEFFQICTEFDSAQRMSSQTQNFQIKYGAK
jgi:hypothetical protein